MGNNKIIPGSIGQTVGTLGSMFLTIGEMRAGGLATGVAVRRETPNHPEKDINFEANHRLQGSD